MLLSKPKTDQAKTALVMTRNPAVKTLLAGILAGWGVSVTDDPLQAGVVFVERGLATPDHHGILVWLAPLPVDEGRCLQIPIALAGLYRLLEEEIFPSTRRHIRVTIDCAADIQIDGAWQESRLVSLSDRGGRLICEHELPRNKALIVETKLAGRTLRQPAEVLYCIPPGDTSGREKPQIGVLFKPLDRLLCEALRKFIELTCVQRVCSKNQIALTDPALSWFALTSNPWGGLNKKTPE